MTQERIEAAIYSLPRGERLAQLAEECAELSHAALKLRRALEGVNPTPVTVVEAEEGLEAEIADVILSIFSVVEGYEIIGPGEVCERMEAKMLRWARRLTDMEREDDNDQ